MEQTGTGLINRKLIKAINRCQRQGERLTVLYAGIDESSEAAVRLQRWLQGHKQLLWSQQLGEDYYGFFRQGAERSAGSAFSSTDEPPRTAADILVEAAAQALGDAAPETLIHAVPLRAADTDDGTETMVYRAIKEAQLAARESRFLPRSKAQRRSSVRYGRRVRDGRREPVPAQGAAATIGELAVPIPSFPRDTEVSEIARLMSQDAGIHNVVIVDGQRPVGLVMKEKLNQLLAGQYGMPLYWRRPVSRIMDSELLVIESSTSVEVASQRAMARDDAKLYDVVTVTCGGKLLGAASIRAMLEAVTSRRTEAARTANPLTGLPGNEGIQRELARMLESGRPFSIVYADLDYFKWFNDTFGFRKGDDMIRFTGELLQAAEGPHAECYRFVGHIGGDDFIVLTDDMECQLWCHSLLRQFDLEVRRFYGETEVTEVSDRHGQTLEREGVTLSLSLMMWDGTEPATPESISALAAQLKKRAKSQRGSICVAEFIQAQQHREEGR
ncbi:GGDEF domain-containing protein [Paenibacillus sp. 1P07SE]|uniref:GGDEF domain-containing protein n=1 Tax=Paenibacillus sp. 1P07SE TaxID=3132209 RepID=UPI0039A4AA8F